jgi:CRP-like cAMP-binding protein
MMQYMPFPLKEPQSRSNRLLVSLPQEERARIEDQLEPMTLKYRQVLYGARRRIDYVYFLDDGVASLVSTMKNGDAAEVGTIGNEGIVGLPIVQGEATSPTSAYMQVPGRGRRMDAHQFRSELERSPELREALQHYSYAFFNQVAQSAACAHFHTLTQRCCRWLLMTHERMQSEEFLLTQEFLAMMLGLRRRATITEVMGKLQAKGLVKYRRGVITILDRKALLAAACECYLVTKADFDRLLGDRRRDERIDPPRPAP